MLKIEHVCAEPYLHDISFTLEDCGMIRISSSDCKSEKVLADIFCGIQSTEIGRFLIDDFLVSKDTLLEYRKHYVSSLVSDFQIIKNKCVKDIVCMHLSYREQAYYEIMNLWDLTGIEMENMEDLSFEQSFRVLLARCMLKESKILVFYPDSTPLSLKEREYAYELLKKCSEFMLVIIIGDKKASYYADRSIEFHDGYIESDDLGRAFKKKKSIEQGKVKLYSYGTFLSYRYRYRFVYRALRIVMIFMLGCLSLFFLCTNLNVVNMQMKILEKHGQQHFLIEKHAQDFLGNIYSRQYMQFQDKDIKELKNNIKGNLMVSYAPVDFYMANAYLNGIYTVENVPLVSSIGVYEAEGVEDIGTSLLYGRYPKNYNEVAISLSTVQQLIAPWGLYPENYIGTTFYWYGIPLTVSGVLKDIPYETSYTNVMPYMKNGQFFVKKGFMQQHPLSKMQSFPLGNKRMLMNNRSYEIDRFSENYHYLYYSNGSMVLTSLDTLEEDEVVLSFQTAVLLGFPYQKVFFDDKKTYDEKLAEYLAFIEPWINQNIRLQAYTIATNPDASAFFEKDFVIKGFLLPDEEEWRESYIENGATVYMNKNFIQSYEQSGAGISNILYHGNKEQMKDTLEFLYSSDLYDACLPSADVFQLLILDVQDLNTFLLGSGIFLMGAYSIVFFLLLKKTIRNMKEEMHLWYLYGNSKESIRKEWKNIFLSYIKKDMRIGVGITLFFSFVYLILLVWKLEAMLQQFLSLGVVLILCGGIYLLKKGLLLYILHKEEVFQDWFSNNG